MPHLNLKKLNELVYAVMTNQEEHVGNLKFINHAWKFKAIGYDELGDIVPGGGPLTDQHNTTFDALDEAVISTTLLTPFPDQ